MKLPYLPVEEIEASASRVLADYGRTQGREVRAPVPVEEILRTHLKLCLGFDDLRARLDMPDVLAAIWLDRREVMVDERLDPDERPSMLGRYRFCLAHEIGHWQLHRFLHELQRLHADLFGGNAAPSIICRTSNQRDRIEVQADVFAGCLLMPRSEVVRLWQQIVGPERLKLSELRRRGAELLAAAAVWRGRVSTDPRAQGNDLIELVIHPLADAFEVSPQAMRIRLERIGLIVRDTAETESLFEAQ